jgi:hypothetical protein
VVPFSKMPTIKSMFPRTVEVVFEPLGRCSVAPPSVSGVTDVPGVPVLPLRADCRVWRLDRTAHAPTPCPHRPPPPFPRPMSTCLRLGAEGEFEAWQTHTPELTRSTQFAQVRANACPCVPCAPAVVGWHGKTHDRCAWLVLRSFGGGGGAARGLAVVSPSRPVGLDYDVAP